MKKKTLSVLSLTAAVLLSGCANAAPASGPYALFEIGAKTYYADDMFGADSDKFYNDYVSSAEGVKKIYDAVFDALVQASQPITTTIRNSADLNYETWEKETVQRFADSYKVPYRQAKAALLEQEGYADDDAKKAALLLEEQKKALTKSFKKNKLEPTDLHSLSGDTVLEKYIENATPMIVNHILVKIGNKNNVYQKARITRDEAEKLGTICNRLALAKASGNAFAEIASQSDDGSYAMGGKLGIMDTYTAFVNEFKFGVYAAESALHRDKVSPQAYGLSDELESDFFGPNGVYPNYTLNKVSVDKVCASLVKNSADVGKQDPTASGEDENLYTRNLLFNEYFNTPAAQFLTLSADASEIDYPLSERSVNADNIVVDEHGRPIIVARSEFGVHFITVSYDAALKNDYENALYFAYQSKNPEVTEHKNDNYVLQEEHLGYDDVASAASARLKEVDERVLNYLQGGYVGLPKNEQYLNYAMFAYYFARADVKIANDKIKRAVATYAENVDEGLTSLIKTSETSNWTAYLNRLEYDRDMRKYLYKEGE